MKGGEYMNTILKRITGLFAVTVLLLGLTSCTGSYPTNQNAKEPTNTMNPKTGISDKELALRQGMRQLWEDHIIWTRLVIIDIVDSLGSAESDTNRLLQNPTDIAEALEPYYGAQNADKVASLLKDHLTIAAELVTAAKEGDSAKATDAETRWQANADAIASALSGLNPNWPEADLKNMLREHLSLTKQEAVNRINKEYAASVTDYDQIHMQALMMADALSAGIIKQFPDKF